MFEHAKHAIPHLEHGYCTDDVARALVVCVREPAASPQAERLARTCLRFLARAQRTGGGFRNRLSVERRWLGRGNSDDAWARALHGLAAAAVAGPAEGRASSLRRFRAGAALDSPSPRANATAAVAAATILTAFPDDEAARALARRAAGRLGDVCEGDGWIWPERRLAWGNALLAEGRIAAGTALGRRRLVEEGLRLLDWLVALETRDGCFSFTPVGGWGPGEPRPGFDQQPIEAGAMADACARAYALTGDERWAERTLRAAAWFLGRNDIGVPLLDATTGGCRDGLEAGGCNLNQGAESTIALIGALQQARAVLRGQAAARSARTISPPETVAAPTQRSAAPYVR